MMYPFSLKPRFCRASNVSSAERESLPLSFHPWNGVRLERDDDLLGPYFGDDNMIDCNVIAIFHGEADDEWSILFNWADVNSTRVYNRFWAEAWYDHEDNQIHCYVRRCGGICGPGEGDYQYARAPLCRSLGEFEGVLEDCPWDTWCGDESTTTTSTTTINDNELFIAERARSREYKHTYAARRKEAVAMGLHDRLGSGSLIACLGADILCGYVLRE